MNRGCRDGETVTELFLKEHGEENAPTWLSVHDALLKEYSLENIYNTDETAYFWKMQGTVMELKTINV